MILRFAKRALGWQSADKLDRYARLAERIVDLSASYSALSDAELRARGCDLQRRARAGTPPDDLRNETFALVREAARRTLGEPHVPAQLICGLALHDGCIADMKTGEGKTLAATLTCALHALEGRGVHIATPNDYLAERDAGWMRPIYEMLGLSVGVITQDLDDDDRRRAYACDITYAVASELAFDYLRDNMKFTAAETVQRAHAFALIDEADAVLIDEAGMPLSLFGSLGDQSAFYQAVDRVVATLAADDCKVEPTRRVTLTDQGYDRVESGLRACGLLKPHQFLHDIGAVTMLHHVTQAMRARRLLQRDRDYIVQDHSIVIIDKLSGRPMPGRRYDEGLHQALEAKEGCPIGEEIGTLASITFQTFFGLYDRIAGMTGTASADAEEYRQIYDLDVIAIPTHRPVIRTDNAVMYPTVAAKMQAIRDAVNAAHARRQPVLIGAPSIEKSERLAAMLEADGWTRSNTTSKKSFSILNAKHHANEARIIAQAGLPYAVTIATAMAGRGTDIRLGGANGDPDARDRVAAAGGLLVIGSEHYELRRLDDQLRGRSGRQGDPGQTLFLASLEDDLFGETPIEATATDAPIRPAIARRVIEAAQKRNAMRNFNDRLGLLRFDATVQRQRETIYAQRREIRDDPDPMRHVRRCRDAVIDEIIQHFAPASRPWHVAQLDGAIRQILTLAVPLDDIPPNTGGAELLRARIGGLADRWMNGKVAAIGHATLDDILRRVMLALIDQFWTEQTERLEHLKRIVRDRRLPPHQIAAEFEIEAFAAFEAMRSDFHSAVTSHAMRLGLKPG
jgi:preprotein translocase subunit SecA